MSLADKYVKLLAGIQASTAADYYPNLYANNQPGSVELTSADVLYRPIQATNSAASIVISDHTTVYSMVVYHANTSIDLTVTWTDTDSNANTQVLKGQSTGNLLVVSNLAPATAPTFTADSSTVNIDVWFIVGQ